MNISHMSCYRNIWKSVQCDAAKFGDHFPKLSSTLKTFLTGAGEAEDAGRVFVSGRVEAGYPAAKVPPDVVDVIVPVDGHGHGVGRTHPPQCLTH